MNCRHVVLFGLLLGLGFSTQAAAPSTTGKTGKMKITSTALTEGGAIPRKYTCDGPNLNPPLAIEGAPAQAKSLALIVDDPDAPRGTWNHWLVWNIDPKTTELKENSVPPGAVQGTTDFGSAKYGGPCPPSGTHRYFFRVYAVDTTLNLTARAKRADLDKALAGHVLAEGTLMGKYARGR